MSTETLEYPRLGDIRTLDDIPTYIFSRPFVHGPPEFIQTPELCAGFLFHRNGDRTRHRVIAIEKRHIGNRPHWETEWRTFSTIEIHFSVDGMEISSIRRFPVAPTAVRALEEGGFLEHAIMQGELRRDRLRLNADGKHKVVTEWFRSSSGLLDHLNAGGVIDLAESTISYPRSI